MRNARTTTGTSKQAHTTINLQAVEDFFHNCPLLCLIEFTDTRRRQRAFLAANIPKFVTLRIDTPKHAFDPPMDMSISALVSRLLLCPYNFRCVCVSSKHFAESCERERGKFFDTDKCYVIVEGTRIAFFDQFIVYFAR